MSRRKSSSKNKRSNPQNSTTGVTKTPVSPPLHSEDADLWVEVTKSLTPLKDDHDRLHFGPLLDEKPAVPEIWPLRDSDLKGHGSPASLVPPQKSVQKQGATARQIRSTVPQIPDLGNFSRREMRQINSGRQSIEARLDLHGLRQHEAHVALRGFLIHSQSRDLRHVLVITGKGRSSPRDEMMFFESETGVLRRLVPLWLAEPDLRVIVSGYNEAPRRHGGEGALYVRLRRNR